MKRFEWLRDLTKPYSIADKSLGRINHNPDAMELDLMEDYDNNDSQSEDGPEEALNAITKGSRKHNKTSKKVFRKKPKDPKMNNNEKIRCMQEGLCFKCKERGHRIRDCPTWQKDLKARAQ